MKMYNTNIELNKIINSIEDTDKASADECLNIWDAMGKPIGALGDFESIFVKLASIQKTTRPTVAKKALVVMCADNGVVEEGITQTGAEVTAIVAENFFDYKTATSIMCKKIGCDMRVVDIGMISDTPRTEKRKTLNGTHNFTKTKAIPEDDVIKAIMCGIEIAKEVSMQGYNILATGEMGIGNTTTSSAIASMLLDVDPSIVTGKGAGLSDEGLIKKIDVIRRGIESHFGGKDRKSLTIIDILSAVGGLDICGMVGLYLGAAINKIPVVIDGFISAVAALCAARLCEKTIQYMIPSHMSLEIATKLIFEDLGMNPPICANMHLGEGSGALMLLQMLDMVEEVFVNMGTFSDIGVVPYEKYE